MSSNPALFSVRLLLKAVLVTGFLAISTVANAETREIIANPVYEKHAIGRWTWGNNYRPLWIAPINVEVLDLQGEAGGLTPLFAVGGTQTAGLAFEGADGLSYTFRAVDKNHEEYLPPEWIGSIIADRVQDQVSAAHPGIFPVVSGLAESLTWMVEPAQRLVVMPNDPALGEHRQSFAGMLGTFGEFPSAATDRHEGFMGTTEILSTRDLWPRWEESPQDINSERFLRYRIFDLWIGNWDRHSKQWRWAYSPEVGDWRPIAEDPDQALSDYQGWMLKVVRWYFPNPLTFNDRISGMEGATRNGADIDRWLLTDLDRETFMRTARSVQAELTDEVIDSALKRMPAEWYELSGEQLASRLKIRRDNLLEAVERYYLHLSGQVSIRGTDQAEKATIQRREDGSVTVGLSLLEEDVPYYQRNFIPSETRALRIYLYGGDDEIVTTGPGSAQDQGARDRRRW